MTGTTWAFHSELTHALSSLVDEFVRDSLFRRRIVLAVFDSDKQSPTCTVGETDAVLRYFGPVRGLVSDFAEGLAIDVLVFERHAASSPDMRRGRRRSRARTNRTLKPNAERKYSLLA